MNTNPHSAPRVKGAGTYVKGMLQAIMGGILVFSFGVTLIVSAGEGVTAAVTVVVLVFLLAGILLLYRGANKCRLFRVAQQIRGTMQNRPRERLSLLAQVTRKNYTQLVRDLRELSHKNIFPGSYVDLNRREFVLVPGGPQPPIVQGNTQLKERRVKSAAPIYAVALTWFLYAMLFPLYRWFDFLIVIVLSVVVSRVIARVAPERLEIVEAARKVDPPKPPEKINTGDQELDEVLTAAMEYMNELTALDIAITNERIDKPLQELVSVCKQIFDYIRKTPGKIRQIRQFMNYYLPTTIKLLKNYDELSRVPMKGDNIKKAMGKIEDAMETILKAFQKELDSLYEDRAMDISVDIEVLQNMMDQEGLGGEVLQFKQNG